MPLILGWAESELSTKLIQGTWKLTAAYIPLDTVYLILLLVLIYSTL